jgi:hypothetical protein
MSHECHWPGCGKQVPARMWGCPQHWFRLPQKIRDAIWKAYRPGQGIDKRPSDAYLEAAKSAREWIVQSAKVNASTGTGDRAG